MALYLPVVPADGVDDPDEPGLTPEERARRRKAKGLSSVPGGIPQTPFELANRGASSAELEAARRPPIPFTGAGQAALNALDVPNIPTRLSRLGIQQILSDYTNPAMLASPPQAGLPAQEQEKRSQRYAELRAQGVDDLNAMKTVTEENTPALPFGVATAIEVGLASAPGVPGGIGISKQAAAGVGAAGRVAARVGKEAAEAAGPVARKLAAGEAGMVRIAKAGTPEEKALLDQAFADWKSNKAYVDGAGNYRVRPEPATPTHKVSGTVAPWNKEVKRLYPTSAEFNVAAREAPNTAAPLIDAEAQAARNASKAQEAAGQTRLPQEAANAPKIEPQAPLQAQQAQSADAALVPAQRGIRPDLGSMDAPAPGRAAQGAGDLGAVPPQPPTVTPSAVGDPLEAEIRAARQRIQAQRVAGGGSPPNPPAGAVPPGATPPDSKTAAVRVCARAARPARAPGEVFRPMER